MTSLFDPIKFLLVDCRRATQKCELRMGVAWYLLALPFQ
jgi:hypothetical protein